MGIALASIAQRCVSTPGDHLHTGKSSRDIVFDPSMKPSTSQENFLANPNNKTRLKTLGNLTPHQAARWDRDSVEAGSWWCWSTHLRRSSWGPTSGHGPGSEHRCTGDTCCNHPFKSKGSLCEIPKTRLFILFKVCDMFNPIFLTSTSVLVGGQ